MNDEKYSGLLCRPLPLKSMIFIESDRRRLLEQGKAWAKIRENLIISGIRCTVGGYTIASPRDYIIPAYRKDYSLYDEETRRLRKQFSYYVYGCEI